MAPRGGTNASKKKWKANRHDKNNRISKWKIIPGVIILSWSLFHIYETNKFLPTFKVNIHRKETLMGDSVRVEEKTTTTTTIAEASLPTLVLHIGPHKTATSAIQCALSHYQEKLYKNAAVAYIGRVYDDCVMTDQLPKKDRVPELKPLDTRELMSDCFEESSPPPSECKKKKSWKMLEDRLKYFSNRKESVLLSDEAFARIVVHVDDDNVDNQQMFYELCDKYYPGRVHVVIVYRRYFEWIVSKWNSSHKPTKNYIPDENNPYVEKYKKWPADGGSHIKTFLKAFANLENRKGYSNVSARANLHPVEYLRSLWINHSSEVMILNMHEMMKDAEGTTTRFFRDILSPLAGDTLAKAAAEDTDPAARANTYKNIDFDRLAVTAHEQELLGAIESTPRHKVAEMAEKHLLTKLNATIDHLPQICPDETQTQQLLNRSLEYEQRIFPDQSEEASKELKSAFQSAMAKGKFCHLDTDKLIEDDDVREFFSTDIVSLLP